MPVAGSGPGPAWLDEHLSRNEGETGLIPHRARTGSPGQRGKPPGPEHHHQAALGPGDLRAGTRADTLTSGLDGPATPLLSLPEPHPTPRLPLRSLGNRNAPMTPSNKLAGSLPLRAVNIHEFPPWGQQVVGPCTLPLGWPPTLPGPQRLGSSFIQGLSKVPGALGPRTQVAAEPGREPGTGSTATGRDKEAPEVGRLIAP